MRWFEEELQGNIAEAELREAMQEAYEDHIRIMQMEFSEAEIEE